MSSSKPCLAILSIMLALPMTAYSEERRSPPPGAMQNGAYLRVELTKSSVDVCAGAGFSQMLYKELKVGATRTQFCQCTYENYFAKFNDEELVHELKLMRQNLEHLEKLTDREKNDINIKAERNKQRLAQSETYCMNKMKVSVTPSSN